MGGIGSGGHGAAGRKPDEVIDETQPPEPVDPPAGLSGAELAVWEELAPLALGQRTLIRATARRFALFCRAVVMEKAAADKILADGLTYIAIVIDGSGQERESLKAHPLCGAHRGLMQRVEAGMTAFRLAPIGKPLPPTKKEKPKSALERLQNIRAVS